MKKRGQLTAIAIVTLLIAVVILLTLPNKAKADATGITALKTALSRDIALTINTLCSHPDDFKNIEYPYDLSKFILVVFDGKVRISDTSFVRLGSNNKIIGNDPFVAIYDFQCHQNPNFIFDKPKKITFNKKEGQLTINENENI